MNNSSLLNPLAEFFSNSVLQGLGIGLLVGATAWFIAFCVTQVICFFSSIAHTK